MTKKVRVAFFLFFVAIFFLTAIVVLLYNTGRRYDFQTRKIVHTGSVSIRTYPKDAQIFINNVRTETTPAVVNNLLPNTYTITLKKDGYHEWEKMIRIFPAQATILDHIYLFYNNTRTTTQLENITLTKELDHTDTWFVVTQTRGNYQLKSFDKDKTTTKSIKTISEEIKNIFPIDEERVIAEVTDVKNQKTQYVYYDRYTEKNLQNFLPELETLTATPKPHPHNKKEFFLLSKNKLWLVHSEDEKIKQLVAKDVLGFEVKKEKLILIQKKEDGIFLSLQDFQGTITESFKIDVPESIYEFLEGPEDIYTLLDTPKEEIYIIKMTNVAAVSKLPMKIKKAVWKIADQQLLLSNDFEIWLHTATGTKAEEQNTLLLRQSTPIQHVAWFFQGPYIFISDDEGVHLIELDAQDIRQKITLYPYPVKNFTVHPKGNVLFLQEGSSMKSLRIR